MINLIEKFISFGGLIIALILVWILMTRPNTEFNKIVEAAGQSVKAKAVIQTTVDRVGTSDKLIRLKLAECVRDLVREEGVVQANQSALKLSTNSIITDCLRLEEEIAKLLKLQTTTPIAPTASAAKPQ